MLRSTKRFFCMFALHMCSGRPVRGRLLVDEIVGRLAAVAQRQRAVQVQVGRLLDLSRSARRRESRRALRGLVLRLPHVALHDARRWPG